MFEILHYNKVIKYGNEKDHKRKGQYVRMNK
jgi:hypothetical protein